MHDWTEWQTADNKTVEELVQQGGFAVRTEQDENQFACAEAIEIEKRENAYAVRNAEIYFLKADEVILKETADKFPENFDFRALSAQEQTDFAANYMDSDKNIGSETAHYVMPNQLMDYLDSMHYEAGYEAAKAFFVPQAEMSMPKEDADKFETIDFSDRTPAADYPFGSTEPNYSGTGKVFYDIELTAEEAINLSGRAADTDRTDGSSITAKDFQGRNYAEARLSVDATTKEVSIDVKLITDSKEVNYSQIALKPEEAKAIFDEINATCQAVTRHDIHDEIRELRKGAEHEELQKVIMPEPPETNRKDDYDFER